MSSKKQQFILLGSGAILFCLIYFFGRTIPPRKASTVAGTQTNASAFDFKTVLAESKKQLTPSQQAYINQLEVAVVRGDVKDQKIRVLRQVADFWKDSAHFLLPYAYYTGEAAKLENSEKSLTFAAHKFLEGVRGQENMGLRTWLANSAKELFEKALVINPSNDSSRVGLGSCYLFGNISPTPMEGINKIREVAERDPSNMYAQFVLGLGAMESGQFDKAIERFLKVVQKEPANVEAVLSLAEAYERTGNKENAIKWYEKSKKFFQEKNIIQEIDARISLLKQ